MSELKNSWHTELAIGILINDEKDLETKLSLLTEIGLTSKNQETFSICEKLRERLCAEESEKERGKLLFSIPVRPLGIGDAQEKLDALNGDE